MEAIKFTLIGDGSSDKILLNIIKWTINNLYPTRPSEGTFADFRHLRTPPSKSEPLAQIQSAERYFPYDLLFYHRDAERSTVAHRKEEILTQLDDAKRRNVLCVVPVKMMESWLLIDGEAIKKAAGNRNYTKLIPLPPIKNLEKLPDPKETLHKLLKDVSGLKGRKLDKFNVQEAVHLVAENIDDFSSLRGLQSFQTFEKDLKEIFELNKWNESPTNEESEDF